MFHAARNPQGEAVVEAVVPIKIRINLIVSLLYRRRALGRHFFRVAILRILLYFMTNRLRIILICKKIVDRLARIKYASASKTKNKFIIEGKESNKSFWKWFKYLFQIILILINSDK